MERTYSTKYLGRMKALAALLGLSLITFLSSGAAEIYTFYLEDNVGKDQALIAKAYANSDKAFQDFMANKYSNITYANPAYNELLNHINSQTYETTALEHLSINPHADPNLKRREARNRKLLEHFGDIEDLAWKTYMATSITTVGLVALLDHVATKRQKFEKEEELNKE